MRREDMDIEGQMTVAIAEVSAVAVKFALAGKDAEADAWMAKADELERLGRPHMPRAAARERIERLRRTRKWQRSPLTVVR